MKVSLVSPLDVKTAIAKYTAELANAIARYAEVTVYHNDRVNASQYGGSDSRFRVAMLDSIGVSQMLRADVIHLQLGNSEFHHFENHLSAILSRGNSPPVILTLHDGTLAGCFRPRCRQCWMFLARHIESVPAAIWRSINHAIKEGHVMRHLPPRSIPNTIWPGLADAVIFHSKATQAMSYFPTIDVPIECIPILAPDFPTRRERTWSPFVFAPGLTLSSSRGLSMLIEAFARGGHSGVRLLIGGVASPYSPNELELLRARADKLGITSRVEFLGFVPEVEFVRLISEAQVVAIPRIQSSGEVSYAMVHALAAGSVILASNVGSFGEYVAPDRGVLVANDVDAWTEALTRVLQSENLRRALSQGAMTYASEFLAPDAVARRHLSLYRNAVAERSSQSPERRS